MRSFTSSTLLACAALLLLTPGCKKETPAEATARLTSAMNKGDTEAVRQMLAKNPELAKSTNPNGVGMVPLIVGQNAPDILELLLKNGADAKNGSGGLSPPIRSALTRGPPTPREVKLLLEYGADPNQKGIGPSPLALAAQWGNLECVKALVEKGADVNAVDTGLKWTVLHHAVRGGNAEVVAYLLEKGAKPNVKDEDGQTPLEMAIELGKPPKTEAEQQKEIEELAKKDPTAAMKAAARAAVNNANGGAGQGKDMTKIIEVLKTAQK